MLQELKPQAYAKVRPLYRGMDHSLSIHATIDGVNPGRIFVDDVERPRTALALTVEGYLLAGDHDNSATIQGLRRLFEQQIITGKVFVGVDSCMVLGLHPDTWQAKLTELIPSLEADRLPRYHYLCREVTFNWRDHVPAGYSIQRIDETLLNDPDIRFSDALEDWTPLGQGWGSLENFLANGVGFCAVHREEAVSRCRADCRAGDRIDVGIITDPAHRGKGLASVVVAATVEYCLGHGFKAVGWHCEHDNIGSWKTAEKVGFERNREYAYFYYIFDPVDQWAQLGWSCFKRGEYEKTTEYYERVFSSRADHPNYYYNCAAEAWGALGNREMALKYLNLAVENGWATFDSTSQAERLRCLHGTPEWAALLARLQEEG